MDLKLAHTWTISRAPGSDTCQVIILELETPDGLVGLGEAAPSARYDESCETVLSFLSRIDPKRITSRDIPGSMAHLDQLASGNHSAKGAVNIALLDLAAQNAGQPLHDLLGLPFQEGRHITSFSIGIDAPDTIRRKVAQAEAFPVLKLKLGSSSDQENLRALRDVAPVKPIRVDANEGWKTKETALRNIEMIAQDGHIQFVEQPMPASVPMADWKWLKERAPLPIMADESCQNVGDVDLCAECFHAVNVKLVKTGGISGAFETLQKARRSGLKTMLGCMIETSVLITAAAHLAELTDYLDLDGNLLITNDPYLGVTAPGGVLSFKNAPADAGLQVRRKISVP